MRDLLVSRDYPGNVRDLRSLVLRIVHRYLGTGFVTVGDIPDDERPAPREPAPPGAVREFEESIRRGPGAGRRARGDHGGGGRRRGAVSAAADGAGRRRVSAPPARSRSPVTR